MGEGFKSISADWQCCPGIDGEGNRRVYIRIVKIDYIMKNSKEYEYICEARNHHPQLSHASNIISKLSGKLKDSREITTLELLVPQYAQYLKKMLNISKYDNI